MIIYPDAAVLVAAAVDEPKTEAALALLGSDASFAVSGWTLVEVASALAIKERTKQLRPGDRQRALVEIRSQIADSFIWLAVTRENLNQAAKFIDGSPLPLRGGDALHLAIAAEAAAKLVTLDRRMAEAGLSLGLDIQLLS